MLKLSYIKPLASFALRKFNKNLNDHKDLSDRDAEEFDKGESVIDKARRSVPDGLNIDESQDVTYTPDVYRSIIHKIAPQGFKGVKTFQELELYTLRLWYEVIRSIKSNESRADIEVSIPESGSVDIKSTVPPLELDTAESSDEEIASDEASEDLSGISLGTMLMFAFSAIASLGVLKFEDYKSSSDQLGGRRKRSSRLLIATPKVGVSKSNLAERMGLTGARVSTDYGVRDRLHRDYEHTGVDFASAEGTPIKSPVDGIVTFIGRGSESAGNYVEVVSSKGLGYRILHMQDIYVKQGQQVSDGDVLGTVGNTGRSSGAHAHVEVKAGIGEVPVGSSIHQRGVYVNPLYDEYYANNISEILMAEAYPRITLSYNKSTTVGTLGNNLMSIQSKDAWLGKVGTYTTSDGRSFTQFDTPEHGLRAGMINLVKYQTKYDVSNSGGNYVTIAEIAQNNKNHSWLSKKYGDTPKSWINAVSMQSGYTPNERIDLRDPETLARVTKGIVFAEHSVTVDSSEVEQIVRHFNIVDGIKSNKQ